MVLKVQLWRGFSGQKGAWLFDLDKPDSGSGNSWRVPENYVLDSAQVELMLRGGLYVLVITSNHVAGEIRGQLLRDGQEVIVNPLTAAQVVTSYLSVDLNTGEVHGTVRHTPGLVVDSLAMHSGIAGLDGDPVLPYEPVPGEPYAWRIPDNTVLTVAQLTLLEQAELYLQVTSDSYPEGELRGQFHLSHYSVISSRLSGMTLIPEISTTASGKAFVTRNNIDGSIQAVLRVSGISPANVILFRAYNPNSTSNGKLLYALEQEQDYWRLPKGEIFETNNLNGKLLLIVTSEEYPLGEIGSLL